MPPLAQSAALPGSVWLWLGVYGLILAAASLLGGALPGKLRLTHPQFQHVISLVAGLMLGVSLLHLMPHAVSAGLSMDAACGWTLGGVVTMFLLIRALHFHVHEPASLVAEVPGGPRPVEVAHECSAPGHDHGEGSGGGGGLGWAGMFFGMAVHTAIDGFALGAGLAAELSHAPGTLLPATGVLAALVLHKPLDAMSVTALMQRDGWSVRWQAGVNVLLAVLCPLGAAVLLLGQSSGALAVGPVLGFAAGVFLCIALADLLPEMNFHSHDRFTLTLSLLAGITLAVMIRFLEPAHLHG